MKEISLRLVFGLSGVIFWAPAHALAEDVSKAEMEIRLANCLKICPPFADVTVVPGKDPVCNCVININSEERRIMKEAFERDLKNNVIPPDPARAERGLEKYRVIISEMTELH